MAKDYRHNAYGYSLIEWMVALTVIAALLALAGPDLMAPIHAQRGRGAAENLRAALQHGRSEAIRRSEDVFVSFTVGADWCYAVSRAEHCGCGRSCSSPDRLLHTVDDDAYPGVQIISASFAGSACGTVACTRFDPVRGTAGGVNGTVILQNDSGARYKVIVSTLGRVRTCRDQGDYGAGLPSC